MMNMYRQRTRVLHRITSSLIAVMVALAGILAVATSAQAAVRGPIVNTSTNQCVDLAGGSSAPGTGAVLATCNGAASQQWTMFADGTIRSLGRCLSLGTGEISNGVPAVIRDCADPARGIWTSSSTVNNARIIRLSTIRVCLTPTGSGTAGLSVFDCLGIPGQAFNLPRFAFPDLAAASLDSVQVAGGSVTLTWTDHSDNEASFQAYRRVAGTGVAQPASGVIATRNTAGQGDTYTFVDTITPGTRVCYEVANRTSTLGVNYSAQVCTAAPGLPGAPAPGVGIVSIVDTQSTTGVQNSIAIGTDGLAIMSYYQAGPDGFAGDNLRVSHCVDILCTGVSVHDVDTVGDVGLGSSIRIGADGLPLISYTTQRNAALNMETADLKVAHCLDVVCSSATITTLDATATVHTITSLTIGGDGLGLIGYEDDLGTSASNIKVAHCRNVACTSASLVVLDTVGGNGSSSSAPNVASIATGSNGLGIIAYLESAPAHADLKVDTCTNADCTLFVSTTIDHSGTTVANGGWSSIAIGRDGLALISYLGDWGSTTSNLKVAHCANLACTAVTTTVADTGGLLGWYHNSTAIGADGLGLISYFDSTSQNLKVAHCTNLVCDSLTRQAIDEFGNVGMYSALAIGADGLPIIAYLNNTDLNLKVAHCGDAACVQPLQAPFITAVPTGSAR